MMNVLTLCFDTVIKFDNIIKSEDFTDTFACFSFIRADNDPRNPLNDMAGGTGSTVRAFTDSIDLILEKSISLPPPSPPPKFTPVFSYIVGTGDLSNKRSLLSDASAGTCGDGFIWNFTVEGTSEALSVTLEHGRHFSSTGSGMEVRVTIELHPGADSGTENILGIAVKGFREVEDLSVTAVGSDPSADNYYDFKTAYGEVSSHIPSKVFQDLIAFTLRFLKGRGYSLSGLLCVCFPFLSINGFGGGCPHHWTPPNMPN